LAFVLYCNRLPCSASTRRFCIQPLAAASQGAGLNESESTRYSLWRLFSLAPPLEPLRSAPCAPGLPGREMAGAVCLGETGTGKKSAGSGHPTLFPAVQKGRWGVNVGRPFPIKPAGSRVLRQCAGAYTEVIVSFVKESSSSLNGGTACFSTKSATCLSRCQAHLCRVVAGGRSKPLVPTKVTSIGCRVIAATVMQPQS